MHKGVGRGRWRMPDLCANFKVSTPYADDGDNPRNTLWNFYHPIARLANDLIAA